MTWIHSGGANNKRREVGLVSMLGQLSPTSLTRKQHLKN